MVTSTKSSKSSNIPRKHKLSYVPRSRLKWLTVGALILAVFVVQSILIVDLYKRQADDPTTIKTLIVQAVQGLGKDVPVDAQSGQLYLADYHLKLPHDQSVSGLRYTSWDDSGLTISSKAAVTQLTAKLTSARTLNDTFDVVPHLQACSRQYVLRFSTQTDQEYTQLGSKKLADGRTIYIYKDSDCTAQVGQLDDYLKQIESY